MKGASALVALACCTPPAVATSTSIPTQSPPSCFLLYEIGSGESRRIGDACATRVTPASTFKIPHALAALDSGVLAGPDVVFAYDPAFSSRAADGPSVWRQSHTLATAMRYSVVWYFQRVAVLLGPDRERAYLERLEYGNRDASSGPTTFWLDEGLRISPEEQEKLLVRLYEDALPVSKAAMRTVRQILVQPAGVVVNALGEHPFDAPWPEGTTVGAKTGTADNVTWLVGSVQRGGRSWVFVSCVMAPSARDPLAAIRLGATSLREAGVL
jgi:beta-lactamase class D